ncbi:hypothetical protein KFL_000050460 [Klebsormidium nitens]|uniref:Uncharacterized protein n=1 Tax=Klebsormidium nitens TaxID=105231 RepID=A0A1Y1HL77_KLENI|nr:hypothetical protein KFL_000050460 [Klebsormidium nitens]|eukprot:GAQ77909.1 hypothetical protein KFL_000050460 [Klebsormidium nitens]
MPDLQDCMIKNVREKDACTLEWHPKQRVLAIAWKDGGVSLWKEQDRKLADDTSGHKRPVSCMAWNAEGTRLVTGDQEGKLVVWKMDLRGKPTAVSRYAEKQDAVISHIRFDTCAAPPADFVDPNLPPPCPPFYYAASSPGKGAICHADDRGKRVPAFEVDCEVLAALYYPERNGMVVITASFTLTVHVRNDSKWTPATKVKLNKAPDVTALQATWAGAHLLALASDKDVSVHLTNLETEENSILELPAAVEKSKKGKKEAAKIAAVAFHERTQTLTIGATDGVVHMWKSRAAFGAASPRTALSAAAEGAETDWEPLPAVDVASKIAVLRWAASDDVIAAMTQEGLQSLIRYPLARRLKGGMALLQTGPSRVAVESVDGTNSQTFESPLQITGVDFSEGRALVWGKQKAEVYELNVAGIQRQAEFDIRPGACCAIGREFVYRTAGNVVEVCSMQGTVKQTLPLDEAHGSASCVDVHGDTLAIATSTGFIKLWRINGRDLKPIGPGAGRRVEMGPEPPGPIVSVRCNCTGTKVSVLASESDGSRRPDSRLFVYEVELDAFQVYDFKQSRRRPINHTWDGEEARMVAVETEPDSDASNPDGLTVSREADVQVTTLFATGEHGLLYQDKVDADPSWSALVGLHVPFLFFASKPPNPQPLLRVPMRDFAGMESVDARTRRALLDFSYQVRRE